MNTVLRKSAIALVGATLAGLLAAGASLAADIKVKLSGDQEVPPVQTQASGSGTITVNDDKSLTGSVTTTGIKATAAHIHEAAAGKNGPVAIPLEKKSDNEFVVPAGARLSDAQYKALKVGNLYVNVHSDAHKDGEIRAQLKP
jgi:biopolymer transport protein ExbD